MAIPRTLTLMTALCGLALAPMTRAETALPAFEAGYGLVPVNSPGVVAAARFAASARSVDIKTIVRARQAETAHLHFDICMRVTEGNTAYLVRTKVSRATGKPYTLDLWQKVKTCPK